MSLPTRILAPTDFSDGATVAQDYAAVLAAALGANLHVLHVIADRPLGDALEAGDIPELVERTEVEVRQRLEGWSSSGDRRRLNVAAEVAIGVPDATILEYANAHGIDLIVMGRSGHGRQKPPRLGHVAVGVLQNARCPVLALTVGSAAPIDSPRIHSEAEGHGAPHTGLQP
jgi:nucleotide-binding universal stress UspA family protein